MIPGSLLYYPCIYTNMGAQTGDPIFSQYPNFDLHFDLVPI